MNQVRTRQAVRHGYRDIVPSKDVVPGARDCRRRAWHRGGVLVVAVAGMLLLSSCVSPSVMDIGPFAGSSGLTGYSGDGANAQDALLDSPQGMAVDSAGNVLIADSGDNVVWVVAGVTGTYYGQAMTLGDIYTIAGNGTAGLTGNGGPAVDAELAGPMDVTLDNAGNVVIADTGNLELRVVSENTSTYYGQAMTAGDIYTIAGANPALIAPFSVSADTHGNIVFSDGYDVKVLAGATGNYYGDAMTAGNVYTLAGGPGSFGFGGYSGDNGPATSALLGFLFNVRVDPNGNVVAADSTNNRIRVIAESMGLFYGRNMMPGYIYTIAGNGTAGFTGTGGQATLAEINDPQGIAFDADDDLLIADSGANVIQVMPVANGKYYGQTMVADDIYTIAGNGTMGSSGNAGLATAGELDLPTDVVPNNSNGYVYVSDQGNAVVRVLVPTSY